MVANTACRRFERLYANGSRCATTDGSPAGRARRLGRREGACHEAVRRWRTKDGLPAGAFPAGKQMLSRATMLLTVTLMGSEPFCFMALMVRMTGSGQHGARHVAHAHARAAGPRRRQGRTPKTPFETENNASRVNARRNRRLAKCVGCGQKAHGRMIALAEFARTRGALQGGNGFMPKAASANPPRAAEGASAQASLIRFAVGLPIGPSWHCCCVAYGAPPNHLQRCRRIA